MLITVVWTLKPAAGSMRIKAGSATSRRNNLGQKVQSCDVTRPMCSLKIADEMQTSFFVFNHLYFTSPGCAGTDQILECQALWQSTWVRFLSSSQIRGQDGWVRSANATAVQSSPPNLVSFFCLSARPFTF